MIQIQLSSEIEDLLRRDLGDLDRTATEALLLQVFREGKLTHYELSQALGLDRFETNAFLKRNGVYEGSLTPHDLDADRSTLDRVLGSTD
jgi:hypothetical protein